MSNANRCQTTIIVFPGIKMFHFCGCGMEGIGNEAWYPYEDGKLFEAVEKYLSLARVAHNVVKLEEKQRVNQSIDYIVTFNKQETDDAELEARADLAYSIAQNIESKTDDLETESMIFRKWAGILGGFVSLKQMKAAYNELLSECRESHYFDLETGEDVD